MDYNIEDKFVIEIEETADCNCPPWRLYKMKGFNSLVFDEAGLGRLEKVEDCVEKKEKYFTGKVVCISRGGNFTVGKVYNVLNCIIEDDNGYLTSGLVDIL